MRGQTGAGIKNPSKGFHMLKPRAIVQDVPEPELTLETVSPEFAEMNRIFQQLIADETELEIKIRPLAKAISASGLALFNEHNALNREKANSDADKPPRMIGPSKGASDLLGKFAPAPTPAPLPLAYEPAVMKEANEVSRQLDEVREALKILTPKLTRAHLDASAKLCDLLRPSYGKIAQRVCNALLELGRADVEQREFMLKHRSVARSTLRVVHATGSLGDPREYQSEFRRLLYWAAECGHFDLADLPVDWPGSRDSTGIHSWPVT
jgi:hypothetical protein